MKKIKYYQVDAFTNKQFKGNPAGVCLLEETLSDDLMQAIAAENNLSETAFVWRVNEGFQLRWFTPTVEIALCGHGTLATAYVLWQQNWLQNSETAVFFTQSGRLTAVQREGWIELDFPASPAEDRELPAELLNALKVKPVQTAFAGGRFIVELADASEVKLCTPNFNTLKDFDMVVITSRGEDGSGYDFISRTFGPSHGIDEDPVTGSSHCCLTPYWSKQLGKTEMLAYQASARGGELRVKNAGSRVLFSGQAVSVLQGEFLLQP